MVRPSSNSDAAKNSADFARAINRRQVRNGEDVPPDAIDDPEISTKLAELRSLKRQRRQAEEDFRLAELEERESQLKWDQEEARLNADYDDAKREHDALEKEVADARARTRALKKQLVDNRRTHETKMREIEEETREEERKLENYKEQLKDARTREAEWVVEERRLKEEAEAHQQREDDANDHFYETQCEVDDVRTQIDASNAASAKSLEKLAQMEAQHEQYLQDEAGLQRRINAALISERDVRAEIQALEAEQREVDAELEAHDAEERLWKKRATDAEARTVDVEEQIRDVRGARAEDVRWSLALVRPSRSRRQRSQTLQTSSKAVFVFAPSSKRSSSPLNYPRRRRGRPPRHHLHGISTWAAAASPRLYRRKIRAANGPVPPQVQDKRQQIEADMAAAEIAEAKRPQVTDEDLERVKAEADAAEAELKRLDAEDAQEAVDQANAALEIADYEAATAAAAAELEEKKRAISEIKERIDATNALSEERKDAIQAAEERFAAERDARAETERKIVETDAERDRFSPS